MRRRLLALGCVYACLLTACGVLPGGGGTERRTVTVWLMKDSASPAFLERFTRAFERTHDDLRLDIRIQQWTGIGTKVQSALGRTDGGGPDVIEVGNTQVAQYVDGGGLFDLTLESMRDWGMDHWLPGLAQPGRFGGHQYGVPWYAANRVVIYRKDLFARAGITEPPKTREQWLADTAELDSRGTQGIYLPGQDWYTLSGFIWDEGGDLAEQTSGQVGGHTADARGAARHGVLPAAPGPRFRARRRRRGTPPQAGVFAEGRSHRWPYRGSRRPSRRRTPSWRGSWGTSPYRAGRRPTPGRSSPAAPTWSSPRTPTTAPVRPRSSPHSRAPPGRPIWPAP